MIDDDKPADTPLDTPLDIPLPDNQGHHRTYTLIYILITKYKIVT